MEGHQSGVMRRAGGQAGPRGRLRHDAGHNAGALWRQGRACHLHLHYACLGPSVRQLTSDAPGIVSVRTSARRRLLDSSSAEVVVYRLCGCLPSMSTEARLACIARQAHAASLAIHHCNAEKMQKCISIAMMDGKGSSMSLSCNAPPAPAACLISERPPRCVTPGASCHVLQHMPLMYSGQAAKAAENARRCTSCCAARCRGPGLQTWRASGSAAGCSAQARCRTTSCHVCLMCTEACTCSPRYCARALNKQLSTLEWSIESPRKPGKGWRRGACACEARAFCFFQPQPGAADTVLAGACSRRAPRRQRRRRRLPGGCGVRPGAWRRGGAAG